MIRKCYIDLAWICFGIAFEENMRGLMIGSPGTGKTLFMIFIHYILIQAGNAPILIALGDEVGFYHRGSYYILEAEYLREQEAGLNNIFYLYDRDEKAPVRFSAISMMFSSPKKDRYRCWEKGRCFIRFMPLWTLEELYKLNSIVPEGLGRLSERELERRFAYTGGVPRHIYEDYDFFDMSVKTELSDVDVSYFAETANQCFEKGPHMIVGIDVHSEYFKFNCIFLSQKLANMVYDRLVVKSKKFVKIIMRSIEAPEHPGMAAQVFQRIAMEQICSGLSTDLIPLNEKAQAMLNTGKIAHRFVFGPATPKMIYEAKDLALEETTRTVWVPESKTFPVVDYFYTQPRHQLDTLVQVPLLVMGLQMTVNAPHGIKHNRLSELVQKFGDDFVLVWVVGGRQRFNDFGCQNQLDSNDKIVDQELILPVAQFKINVFSHEAEEEEKKGKKKRRKLH
jgi:hypothetical protein